MWRLDWESEVLKFFSFGLVSKLSATGHRIIDSVLQVGPKDPIQRKRKFLPLGCCSAVVDHTIEAEEANALRKLCLVKCL